MKHIKLFEEFGKSKWQQGVENTKIFKLYTKYEKRYYHGCRTCNEVLPVENMYYDRQMLGNLRQTLCNCSVCGNYLVLDEQETDSRDSYLKNKEEMDAYHNSRIRKGLHINVYSEKLEGLEPNEITESGLFVYVKESHTDDLMDDPFNHYHIRREYYLILDLDRKRVYCPYPESTIDKYPLEIQKIFKRYISEYRC